jgi:chorismate mutase/prephenate dehydratase
MSDRRREVAELRREMTEADQEILRGILRRARLARRVGELEASSTGSMPPNAERDFFAALEQEASGEDLPFDAIKALFRHIHATTSSLERPSRVAYVGPEGGFGHLAAQRRFGQAAPVVATEAPELALDQVQRRRADFAVFPFESSTDGPLQSAIDALSRSDLSLVAKVELIPNLSLMSRGLHGSEFSKVYVFAADRPAAQQHLLSLIGTAIVDVRSPLAACQLASEDPASAALVPQETGEQMGLSVVQANVNDSTDVRVRYGIASARPTSRSGQDTTSILFGAHDQPGALFGVLRHFAERDINLETIQSRPVQGEGWNYLFYVELTGHVTDRSLVTALEEVKRQTRFFKILGSFPSC